jgi:hypothetical protein
MEEELKEQTEKVCSRCQIKFPINNYTIRRDARKPYIRGVCRECHNTRTRDNWRKLRVEIFNNYGWECKCCGETIKEFLSLDHINNDGYLDKNPNGDKKSGKELYLLVKRQGFPEKYQTLCMNCNWGKKIGNGVCPHNYNR